MGAIMSLDVPVSSLVPSLKRHHGMSVWWAFLGIGAVTMAVGAVVGARAVNSRRANKLRESDGDLKQDCRRVPWGQAQGGPHEGPSQVPGVSCGRAPDGSIPPGDDQLFFSLLEAYAGVDTQASL
uniref:Uncharacterized protein n=1 Tax=Alexandrium andersonii TaxID=327968 RepID=A0A7S2BE28_9DINO